MAKEEKGKAPAKGKGAAKEGKWSYYKAEGESVKRERKSCPKCGGGVFMAQHQDRVACGKCGYTEFIKEKIIHVFPEHHKSARPKEEKKESLPAKGAEAKESAPAKGADKKEGKK